MHTLRLALEVKETRSEGPGQRYALWVQGCPLRCPGCCNPQMLPFEGGYTRSTADIIADIRAADVVGVTFLGGEPFEQARGLATIAKAARAEGLNTLAFTGHALPALRKRAQHDAAVADLLDQLDAVVDGPYRAAESPDPRRFVGSKNQQIHFLTDALDLERWGHGVETVEIRLRGREISINGWPAPGTHGLVRRGRHKDEARVEAEQPDDDERQLLAFLEAALTGRHWAPAKAQIEQISPHLAAEVMQRVQAQTLRFLMRDGIGERATLRGDAIIHARPMDRLPPPLGFGHATQQLWMEGPRALAKPHHVPNKRQLKQWLINGSQAGDWLVHLMLYHNLQAVTGEVEAQEAITARLARTSPLVALARAKGHPKLKALLTPEHAPLLELLEGFYAREHLQRLREGLSLEDPRAQWERFDAFHEWLKGMEAARRLDLTAPLLRALAGLPEHLDAAAARRRLFLTYGDDRQRRIQAYERLFQLVERLARLRADMRLRYGDPRYAEGQLFGAAYDARFAEAAAALEAARREVVGFFR